MKSIEMKNREEMKSTKIMSMNSIEILKSSNSRPHPPISHQNIEIFNVKQK